MGTFRLFWFESDRKAGSYLAVLGRYVVYLLFFLSGSTGLIYEVLWHRKLALIFGSTVYAAATVLTVFFSGLALGAFLIGRSMDRGRNPVVAYALLEGLIGLFGICSPLVFGGIDAAYLAIVRHVDTGLAGLTAARFVLAYLALLLPTTLMGATLPVLVKLVSDSDDSVSFNAGRLYGVNTIGAAVGALMAGIVVVPWLGVNESILLTGVLNVLIGGAAFALFGRLYTARPVAARAAGSGHTMVQRYLLAFFCVAGFISMVYQVAWIRVLSQINGSSVYAFGLILSVFIVGVGLGSEVATRLLRRLKEVLWALIAVEVAASMYTLLLVNYYDHLPLLYTYMRTGFGLREFGGSFVINVVVISVMLLFPTLVFGAAFPLLAAVYARSASSSGGDVGAVYAVNTIGGVLGSFVGGFVLLPNFGSQTTIIAMGVLGLALSGALAFLVAGKARKLAVVSSCVAGGLLCVFLYKPWNVRLIDSAPYISGYGSVKEHLAAKENARLMYYKEGINVNVSVFGDYEAKTISINGKTMATVSLTDKSNQYLLGHLPMLLHPDPKRSLVIGLGGGMTFSALVRHGEPSDVVEISPEVVDGAVLFRRHNHSVLEQPNARVIFNDGRNYLKTTGQKYDVITEDPLDPFFMGSGYLYNVEHFRNARKALNPGGIMCQYLPLYQVGVEEAKIIIKSFHSVFPHVSAWFSFNDMLLIGSDRPLSVDIGLLQRRIARPEIASDLKEIGIDNVYDLLSNYLFDERSIPEITAGSPLNTDDYPILEYMTPRTLFRDTQKENVAYFSTKREAGVPGYLYLGSVGGSGEFPELLGKYYAARTKLIKSHLDALYGDFDGALSEVSGAISAMGALPFATYYIADIYLRAGVALLARDENREAVSVLGKAMGYRGDYPEIMNPYAEALFKTGNPGQAVAIYLRSLEMEPDQVLVRFNLAQIYLFARDYGKAREMIGYCLGVFPDDVDFLAIKAQIELSTNNKAAAARLVDRVLQLKPGNARALSLKKML